MRPDQVPISLSDCRLFLHMTAHEFAPREFAPREFAPREFAPREFALKVTNVT